MLEQLRGKRVLVTGGCGFVGSNLVRALVRYGADVTVVDDYCTGRDENLGDALGRVKIVRGSVADMPLVVELVKGKEIVFHEAARNIVLSTKDPKSDFEVNIGGTLNVLLAVKGTPVRVVYASSASIFGNARYLPINEDDVTNLLSPYAVSKYSGESYCRAFYESYGVSTSVVRYSNVFGPAQRADNPYCGVVAKFFEAAMANDPLRVHGDGEQTRDFTYVDDVVEATLLAGVAPKAEGQVYNVGTGRETSVNRLARMICEVTQSMSPIEYVDKRDIDNIRRRVLNIEKIRRDLRWVPIVTLEKGLRHTYDWIRASA